MSPIEMPAAMQEVMSKMKEMPTPETPTSDSVATPTSDSGSTPTSTTQESLPPTGGRKRRRSKKAKGKKRKSSKRVKSRKIGKKSRKRRR